jgi:hypothetical protein
MRQSNQIDLRTSSGDRTVTRIPGQSVVYQFNSQQSRIGAGGGGKGLYNYVRGICVQATILATQPANGQAYIPGDLLCGALGSTNLNTPLFGTMIDPNVVSDGHVLKNLLEFFGCGYRRSSVDPPGIPATASTQFTRVVEFYIPIAQGWNEWSDQFAHWLGWFDTAQIEIFANSSADPFAQLQLNPATTPATLNSVTISATLDMIPFGSIVIPPVVALRKYYQAASASSNGPTLIGVGNNGALQGTDDMARLVAMVFAHNAGGLTGSGTADQIATMTLPWRDQTQSLELFGFFQRFLADAKMQVYGGTSVSATAPIAQQFDYPEPYSLGASSLPGVNGVALNTLGARFTPIVWPSRMQKISHQQRVKGNYPLDMTFNANQTNQFNVYTLEIKQYSISKVSEMLAAMGVDPTAVSLYPLFGMKNVRFGQTSAGTPVVTGKVNAKKTFCLPRGVAVNPPTATATATASS